MSTYFISKQLPACFVELGLLLELETYIKHKIEELTSPEDKYSRQSYRAIVSDGDGFETLDGIEDYQRSYFPNGTNRIVLKGDFIGNASLEITITFSLYREQSEFDISYTGNSAREVAIGISEEIKHRLKSYKTSNSLFHPFVYSNEVLPILSVICVVLYWLINYPYRYLMAIPFIPIQVWIYMSFLKPYSTFKTRRNETRGSALKWTVLTLLGALLSAGLLALITISLESLKKYPISR